MSEEYREKTMKYVFFSFLNWISVNTLGVLFWIILAKLFDPSEVGKFSIIYSAAFIFTIFMNFGTASAISKLISENMENKKIIGKLEFLGLILLLVFSSITTLITILLLKPISQLMSISYDFIILSLILGFLLSLLYILSGIIYSKGLVKEFFIVNNLYSLLKIVFIIPLLFLNPNYIGIYISFIFSIIISILHRLMYINIVPKIEFQYIKKILEYSVYALLVSGITTFYDRWGILISGKFFGYTIAAIFTLSFTFSNILKTIPALFVGSLSPLESNEWTKGNKMRVKNTILRSLKYSYILMIPVLVLFLLFPKEILIILSKYEYIKGVNILRLLVSSISIIGITGVIAQVFYFIGMPKEYTKINLSSVLVLIMLTIIFKPLNATYIAFYYFISSLFSFVYTYLTIRKKLNIGLNLKLLIKVLIFSLVSSIPIFLLKSLWVSYISAFFSIIIFLTIYLIFLKIARVFDKNDKKMIEKLITKYTKNKSLAKFIVKSL